MFVKNNRNVGFWIKRTTWGKLCAKVTFVGDLVGSPPYYGNPEVRADLYDFETGELKNQNIQIPVPGTYKTWRQIKTPSWNKNL